jgi:hypothetical protein
MESQPKRATSGLWIAIVVVVSFLVQLFGMSRTINTYDECLELFAAVRILHGDLPYRDFWTMYGPAQFYVIAGIFKIFGVSVLVARVYHAFVAACMVLLLVMLARKLTNSLIAGIVLFWTLVWSTGVIFLSYEFPTYPALTLTLLSVWLLIPLLDDQNRPLSVLLSGFCVGLTTLFRHDFGFYVFLCELAIIATRDFGMPPTRDRVRLVSKRNLRQSAIYLLGLALILLPIAAVILRHVSVHDLYFDLIYVPARIYPKVRSLPFPGLHYLLSCIKHRVWFGAEEAIDYFPIFVGFTSIAYLLSTTSTWNRDKLATTSDRKLHVLLTYLLLLMTLKGMVRVSPVQLIQAIMLAILVLSIIMYKATSAQKFILVLCIFCFIVSAIPTYTVTGSVISRSIANTKDSLGMQVHNFPGIPGGELNDACKVQPGLERMRCFFIDPFQVQAIQYIQAHTSPSDTIYVGAGRHDKLWLNDLSIYFISKRMSGTKWHDLHPGIETTQAIQEQMIADLVRTNTRYVVLDTTWDSMREANQSQFVNGSTVLDEFIHRNYVKAAEFGPIFILKSKEKWDMGVTSSQYLQKPLLK